MAASSALTDGLADADADGEEPPDEPHPASPRSGTRNKTPRDHPCVELDTLGWIAAMPVDLWALGLTWHSERFHGRIVRGPMDGSWTER